MDEIFPATFKLSFEKFKKQIDSLVKIINLQRQCIESVRIFHPFIQEKFDESNGEPKSVDRYRYETFRRSFCQLEKRCRKIEKRQPPFEQLYDFLASLNVIQNRPVKTKKKTEKLDNDSDKVESSVSVDENCLTPECILETEPASKKPRKKTKASAVSTPASRTLPPRNARTNAKKAVAKLKPKIMPKVNETKSKQKKITDKPKIVEKIKCSFPDCEFQTWYVTKMKLHKRIHPRAPSAPRVPKHVCHICNKTFQNVYNLRYHLMAHAGQKFACPHDGCDRVYSSYSTLKKHMRIHSGNGLVHKCDWPGCEYITYKMSLLRKHQTRHTGERKFACQWPDCGKRFKHSSGLHGHMAIHKNERKHACTWDGCTYRCNLSGNLRKHMAIHERKLMKIKQSISDEPPQ